MPIIYSLQHLSPMKRKMYTTRRSRHLLKMDLHDAVRANNLERVRMLVEEGADKDQGDRQGYTPLSLASVFGYVDVTQYLVKQGAALDKANNYDSTPLLGASSCGHLEVARYLLEQGADRDKANNSGSTPLYWAARKGHLEVAMLLMSYGAELNARNKHGQLPIDVAGTEEMKQAIRDEPRRRLDHGHKRATEQDRHPNAAASTSAQQEEENKVEQSNKRPRLDEGAAAVGVAEEWAKVAEEDEDSEPSYEEDDD